AGEDRLASRRLLVRLAHLLVSELFLLGELLLLDRFLLGDLGERRAAFCLRDRRKRRRTMAWHLPRHREGDGAALEITPMLGRLTRDDAHIVARFLRHGLRLVQAVRD